MRRRTRLLLLLMVLYLVVWVILGATLQGYWLRKVISLLPVSPAIATQLGAQPDRLGVPKWCPRCRFVHDRGADPSYCLRCGTAMLDRFCLVCGEPLFGPELMHFTTGVRGGARVL